MNIAEARERLSNYSDDMPCAMVLWGPGDVKGFAQEKGHDLSDERVAEILDELDHRHDASIGISWDTISELLP